MAWLEAGAGWPLILLHGFPLTADMWRPQLDDVPSGWRYIAPHLRGFGDGPPAAAPVSMEDYADDVCALMDAMHLDEAAIGGLSMGGYVAFAMFRKAPERFTAMVLADTRAQADTPEGREGRMKMRALLAADGPRAVAAQMLPKLLLPDAPSEVVDAVRGTIEAGGVPGIDAAIGALMDRLDSTPLLARIGVPTLVVVGEGDAITPVADAEAMQRAIVRSRLTVIPGAAHLANLEQPRAFSRALEDFLRSAL
jgi:3-oxoadipate enol-lactonase